MIVCGAKDAASYQLDFRGGVARETWRFAADDLYLAGVLELPNRNRLVVGSAKGGGVSLLDVTPLDDLAREVHLEELQAPVSVRYLPAEIAWRFQ